MGSARGRREALAAVGPAAALHAVDRHGHLRHRGDEDRPLEDAVLLGADELFALEEQDVRLQRVGDEERPDGAGMVDLGDDEPAGRGFVEPDVLELRLTRVDQRNEPETAEAPRLTELERELPGKCVSCHAT